MEKLVELVRDPGLYLALAEFPFDEFDFLSEFVDEERVRVDGLSVVVELLAFSDEMGQIAVSLCGVLGGFLKSGRCTALRRASLSALGRIHGGAMGISESETGVVLQLIVEALGEAALVESALTALRLIAEADEVRATCVASVLPLGVAGFLEPMAPPGVVESCLRLLGALLAVETGVAFVQVVFSWEIFPFIWHSAARSALLEFGTAFVSRVPDQAHGAMPAVGVVLEGGARATFRHRCESFRFLAAASMVNARVLEICVQGGLAAFAVDVIEAGECIDEAVTFLRWVIATETLGTGTVQTLDLEKIHTLLAEISQAQGVPDPLFSESSDAGG
jgi:hypothetical protein